jgi:EmrB/QacA subfamily drug resistance transporter
MASLLLAGFMNLIDITIVNVAIPSLQDAFDATDSQIEWVVAAYIMAFALCLIPAGRLGDVIGRRRMFVTGVAVFGFGSLLCGMAPSIGALVAARVLQGIGGAMIGPQTLALVPVLFPPRERGLAFALFGLSAGLASVTGPVLGGWLISLDIWGLGWRPIFLVNVPVGLLTIFAAMRFVPPVAGDRTLRLDFVGIALAGLALLLILFPLIEGRQFGWPWWCFALIAAALPVTIAFAIWQRHRARIGKAQLLPVVLFRYRSYVIGLAITMLIFGGIPGFFLVLAFLLQVGNGLTPLESGLTTLPFSLGVLLASVVSGALGLRWPRKRIMAGCLMLAGGMILLRTVLPVGGETLVRAALFPPLIIAGLGLGTAISPLFQTILSNVADGDAGAASGALQAFQQVGGALGLAVMGEVFFSHLGRNLPDAADPVAIYSDALQLAILPGIAGFMCVAVLVWRLPRPQRVPR